MPYNQVQTTSRRVRVVDVPANTAVVVAPLNVNRVVLELMNIDVGRATLGFGSAPPVDAGPALSPASGVGEQGGSWSSMWVPEAGPVYARAGAVATRIAVVEG